MTRELRDSDRFKTRESLVLEEIDDEVVILDLQKNVYFGLNEVAKLVWRGLDSDQSIGEIIDELVDRFDVKREILACDVYAFVEDALANQLVSSVID